MIVLIVPHYPDVKHSMLSSELQPQLGPSLHRLMQTASND